MEISQMCRILRPGRSAHFLSSSHTSSSWPSPSPEHGFSHWFLKQTQSSALSPEAPNRRVHDHVRISEREAVQRWEQRTMRAAILESCLAHALLSAPTQHSGNCLYLLGGVGGGESPWLQMAIWLSKPTKCNSENEALSLVDLFPYSYFCFLSILDSLSNVQCRLKSKFVWRLFP